MNEVELLLTARDNASRVVDEVGRTVQRADSQLTRLNQQATREVAQLEGVRGRLGQQGGQSLERLEGGLGKTARGVRALALPLAAELSPALGQTTSQIASVVVAAASLSSGLTALGIAAVGIGGIVSGQLLEGWKKNREALTEFDRAVRSFDLGRIGEQGQKARRELEELRDELEKLDQQIAAAQRRSSSGAPLPLRQRTRARDLGAERTDLERRRDELAGRYQTAAELLAEAELEQQLLASEQFRERNRLAQRGLFDFTLSPIDASVAQIERDARDLGRAGDPAAAARLRATIPELRRHYGLQFQALPIAGLDEVGRFESLAAGIPIPALDLERIQQQGFAEATRRFSAPPETPGLEETARFEGLTPGVQPEGFALTVAGLRGRLAASDIRERERLLQVERDRAAILREQAGLTEAEKVALDLVLIEREKLAMLADERLSAEQKANVELEAAVRTSARLRTEFERSDFFAGLSKGLREVGDDLTSFGKVGEAVVRNFATTAERTISDLFFLPVERGFKRTFEELPRQVGLSALRILTDTFARMSLGTITRGLGLGGSAFGIGSIGLPGLSLPGFGAATAAAAPINVTGFSPAQLVQLQQAGYSVVGGQSGQSFAIPSVPTSGLTGFIPSTSYIGAALQTPVGAIAQFGFGDAVLGTQLGFAGESGALVTEAAALGISTAGFGVSATATEAAALGIGSAYGAQAGAQLGAGTLGSTLGGVAAGVGFAYSLYSAYAAGSPAYGAVSGALSGAMLGTFIAPGIGTVVGLIAGAALGAGAGALGKKQPKKPSAADRSAAEAAAGRSALSGAIGQAQTLEELVALLNRGGWSPHRQVRVAIRLGNGGGVLQPAVYVDPGAAGPLDEIRDFTVFDLVDNIDRLEVASGPVGTVNFDAALTEQLRARVRELIAQQGGALVSFEEALAGGITRRTSIPGSAIARLRGRQLSVDPAQLAFVDPDQLEGILRALAALDEDRDLQIIRRDPDTDIIVSITSFRPETA